MLRLKTLKFQNIGRFVEKQSIDFTGLFGLIQVDAINKNTGGSSGAGKTTLTRAIEFLLGLNDIPTSILQSRLTKEGIYVEGEFDYNELPLTIIRSKKGLSINLNGEITEGSSKLAEEKLDSILGMSRSLFLVLMCKSQGSEGFFLSFTPKQCHEFLIDAKGLKEHAKKAEQIDLDLKSLNDVCLKAQSEFESAKAALESTTNALLAIGEPPKPSDITEQHIKDLKDNHNFVCQNHDNIIKLHLSQRSELEKQKPVAAYPSFDRTQINAIEQEINNLSSLVKNLENKEKSRQSTVKDQINAIKVQIATNQSIIDNGEKAKIQIQKVAAELKKIKESTCPTCEQSWLHESIKVKESELLTSFEIYKKAVIDGMNAVAKKEEMEKSLSGLDASPKEIPELVDIINKTNDLKSKLTEERKIEAEYCDKEIAKIGLLNYDYIAKLNALSQEQSASVSASKDLVSKSKQELAQALQAFESANKSAEQYQKIYNNLIEQKVIKESSLNSAELSIKDLKEKIEIVSEAKSLIKSFISCSFDDALESIGDKATEILRGIPNMENGTIKLEGTKETAKGVIKEEVTAVLSCNGEEGIPIKSLSGGEKSSADMAIDMAVRLFLEESTNSGIDIICIDEGLTGLDSISAERVLEVLQNLDIKKKILIIDHNDVVKQFVQNKILVTREGDYSTVEVV